LYTYRIPGFRALPHIGNRNRLGRNEADCRAHRADSRSGVFALTAMSPLQYQKQLRLVAARERMLIEGLDAASAAFQVGYESPSQFNREYKRFFGQPPMRDVKTRRFSESTTLGH
jgi:AraC-like DNA-binding protein